MSADTMIEIALCFMVILNCIVLISIFISELAHKKEDRGK